MKFKIKDKDKDEVRELSFKEDRGCIYVYLDDTAVVQFGGCEPHDMYVLLSNCRYAKVKVGSIHGKLEY